MAGTKTLADLKVAIVHYWLVSMRGGEKVVEQLCELFPQADLYTLVARPENLSETIRRHKLTTSFLQRLPGGVKHYQKLLPLMPFAIEQFDLNGYDLVISSDTNVTKGVVTRPGVLHVNYCHTPMRYAWDMYHEYMHGFGLGRIAKMIMAASTNYLRVWDVAAANRVDHFIANSGNVRRRIRKHYRREAEVIPPPVDVETFVPGGAAGDYYLMLGQIIPYKRVDVAVEAFNRNGRRLVIIGEGSERERLKALAKPNVEFRGRLTTEEIHRLYAGCRGFVFPGEEDFGITPLEAQACGRPVIAFGKGGALETVRDGETGLFFAEQTAESLNAAVDRLEAGDHSITPEKCRANALGFSNAKFRERMAAFIAKKWTEHQNQA